MALHPNFAYAQLAIHRWMLRDKVRNEAYKRALFALVKPGDVVLDVGAGSGILSIFAAQAGARKVYAVERTGITRLARKMIEANGLSDHITLLESDLEDVDLPEKVNVIVSEWMGGLGVDENMLPPVVMARNRFLAPGGKMVPGKVTAMMAPGWVEEFAEFETWRSKPHGVDMSPIAALTSNESHMMVTDIGPGDLLADPAAMWSHDAYTTTLEAADSSFTTSLRFRCRRAGKVSGLATWFVAEMGDGSTLSTAVGEPPTHWGQLLLPLDCAIAVKEGDEIAVELAMHPTAPGSTEIEWQVKIGDHAEKHDTARRD